MRIHNHPLLQARRVMFPVAVFCKAFTGGSGLAITGFG